MFLSSLTINGYGDISAHNGPSIQTPHIDRIAQGGIRLTQFYANSSVCSPSRASLMTGRYPDRVGVPGVIRTHPQDNWGIFPTRCYYTPIHIKRERLHHISNWQVASWS